MKNIIKKLLTPTQKRTLKLLYTRVMRPLSPFYARDLNRLAEVHGSDKGLSVMPYGHWYAPHYRSHFQKRRRERLNILEIGVGGYSDPASGGNSLRMWKYYFPRSNIYGMDIHEKELPPESRIRVFRGSQTDAAFLECVHREAGSLDIVIDDGSHRCEDVIATFRILFPLLSDGGIYVCEDTETSYWPEYGGDNENLENPKTTMNFFKGLADCLNHKALHKPESTLTYFDKHIVSIHFYRNLVFVHKGKNV